MSYHFKSFPHHSYTKEKLAKLGLPAADIKYMTAHGLPVLKDYWFDNVVFFDEGGIKPLDAPDGVVAVGTLYENHYIAVSDEGVFIIDSAADSDSPAEADCLRINSSLELFVRFMSIYCRYMDKYSQPLDNDDEKVARRVVSKLERKFHRLDRVALEDENSMWSVLIEEISYIYI